MITQWIDREASKPFLSSVRQRFLVKRIVNGSTPSYYQETLYASPTHTDEGKDKAVFTDEPNLAQRFDTYGEAESAITGFLDNWGSMEGWMFQIEKVYTN